MDKLRRDLQRLECINDSACGLERFSMMTRLGDFVRYYFSRFLSNAKHFFSDFSNSEIVAFNRRYKGQIGLMIKDPLLVTDKLVIPIPKGMIKSYRETVDGLVEILSHITPDQLQSDVATFTQALEHNDPTVLHSVSYGKKNYEEDSKAVAQLYSSKGLTHVTFPHAFASLADVEHVNNLLMGLTVKYYPEALALIKEIDHLTHVHSKATIDPKMSEVTMSVLMGAAYRVTLFALIMEHVQDMEHAFVKSLEVIRQASARTV